MVRSHAAVSGRHKHPLSAVTFQNITPLCQRAKKYIKHTDVRSLTRRMSPRESGTYRALHHFPVYIHSANGVGA